METRETTILIAEDQLIVALGVEAILATSSSIKVAGIVSNGRELLEKISTTPVDLVLMDINMPVMNGLECTKRLKTTSPETKVIILTMYNHKHFIRDIFEAGADGCILKSNSAKELISAIERVISGKTYFDHINEFMDTHKELKEFKLSEREIDIIVMIAEGATSKEISNRLYISEHTVKTHRKNIFQKTQVSNADQLIQWAINNKLI